MVRASEGAGGNGGTDASSGGNVASGDTDNPGTGGRDSSGGQAGAGGSVGCDALGRALCDDSNGCTRDICTDGGCLHEPRKDGAGCDDHDACTTGDSCVAGTCSGAAIASSARLEGELRSFGSYTPYTPAGGPAGLSLALNDELLVFSEPGGKSLDSFDLVLVRRDGERLRPLDRLPTVFRVSRSGAGPWPTLLGTRLVRLTDSRFAVVNAASGIAIYDADGSGLALAAHHNLEEQDGITTFSFWDAEGQDDRLWILDSHDLYVYAVAPDGTPTWLAEIDAPPSTSAFAVSEDGQTIYAGGQLGTFRIDVSDLEHPVVEDTPVLAEPSESRPRQMTVHGDFLFIQSDRDWGSIGDARLHRLPDLELVGSFPSISEVDSPMGAAFTNEGLLLQRVLYDNYEPSELRAELYDLSTPTLSLRDSFTYANLAALVDHRWYDELLPPAQGSHAVLHPVRRVVSTTGGILTEQSGAFQGTFDEVNVLKDGSLLATSPLSSHRIILDESSPQLVAGGLVPPGTSALYRLAFDGSGQASGASPSSLLLGPTGMYESSGSIALLETTAGQAAQPVGSLELPGVPLPRYADQIASDRLLFRMERRVDEAKYDLRVFSLPQTVDEVAAIESLGPIEFAAFPYSSAFAVAQDGGAFVVEGKATEEDHRVIYWYARKGRTFELAARSVLPFPVSNGPLDAVLHGNSVFLLSTDGGSLLLLRRDGADLDVIFTRDLDSEQDPSLRYSSLLGIEGERLYVSAVVGRATSTQYGVDVLSMKDLSFIARYPTRKRMTSLAVSGKHLVMGSQSTLLTATPQCELPGESPFVGDTNGDSCVDQADYDLLVANYLLSVEHDGASAAADFNEDGWVDVFDYLILAETWTEDCPG